MCSYMTRMPKRIPTLKEMLADIGNPTPKEVAKALKVTERTVWRWLRDGKAPHPAMLAIFWLTRWGVSQIHCEAHNDAMYSAGLARSLRSELEVIRERLSRVARIGDFGALNDPAPGAIPTASLQTVTPPPEKTAVENAVQPSCSSDVDTELNPISMRVSEDSTANDSMEKKRNAA